MAKPRQRESPRSPPGLKVGDRDPQSGTHRISSKRGPRGGTTPAKTDLSASAVVEDGGKRPHPRKSSEPPPFPRGIETPPAGLTAATFRVGDEHYAVLTFPVRALELPSDLTRAEREVVLGVLSGRSNQEIARVRGTSAYTVMNQLTNVFRKLDVNSRWELIARCGRDEKSSKKR
jgi:DNA-binding CsgD family transcriptional regulator